MEEFRSLVGHPRLEALARTLGTLFRENRQMVIVDMVRAIAHIPARIACGIARRKISPPENSEPVLGFGGVLAPGWLVHGGAVKLLHFREAFRCDEKKFNVLYLVSSAQPEFAEDLVALCRRRGIRLVWNQNGVGYPGWAGNAAEQHNAPMRRMREAADFVVYQSAFCRSAAERFLGPSTARAAILLNPVDLAKFSPPAKPVPLSPLRLLSLGTHNYAERVLSTIRCLAALRRSDCEAVLTVAGRFQWPNGDVEVRREIECQSLGDSVTVLPAFSQDEAAALYKSHHVLLHPKYLDPCPTVVAEALASGLPVIGSASGGLPEMVPASSGVLIPAPEVWDRMITPTGDELARAVEMVVANLEERSRAARVWAELMFDAGRWVEAHRTIFSSLR
jgi:glycosyltransferase involved in cell wall biosynthesis